MCLLTQEHRRILGEPRVVFAPAVDTRAAAAERGLALQAAHGPALLGAALERGKPGAGGRRRAMGDVHGLIGSRHGFVRAVSTEA